MQKLTMCAAAAVLAISARSATAQSPMLAANGRPVNGISCDAQEGQRVHIHQHVVIFDRGKQVAIPDNIGQPAGRDCIYWLHTHTPDGVIHIEAPKDRSFTLGDFFAIWGVPLNKEQAATARAPKGSTLHVWVDGKPYKGDPAAIKLAAHTDVVIQAGPPYLKPPRFTAWDGR